MLIQIQKNDKLIENLVVEHSKKWVWSIWSLGSKFSCISRMNRWNELIFCMLAQIHTNWKVIENFWGEHGQKLVWSCWWQDSKIDVSEDWTDGQNWFFAYCDTDSQKLNSWSKVFCVGMVKNGYEQSGYGTLKLTVSHKWTDKINWLFACWYKFRKARSWFNEFWLGVVKNGQSILVHETRKSAVF